MRLRRAYNVKYTVSMFACTELVELGPAELVRVVVGDLNKPKLPPPPQEKKILKLHNRVLIMSSLWLFYRRTTSHKTADVSQK